MTRFKQYLKKEEIDYLYKDNKIFSRLMEICSNNRINITARENLNENLDNYNEMGLIQAIDNISATVSVIEVIKDNGYKFNKDKIILYGHSHGAYLSYLANAFAPDLFSLLIDNSSWLFPSYLRSSRYVSNRYGNSILSVEFNYLAKTLDFDEEILYLPLLYEKFNNKCEIICYHGTNDNLISHRDKIILKNIIKNFKYNEIDDRKVDEKIFKSTQHGLGADFLELFYFAIKNHVFEFKDKPIGKHRNIIYETKINRYKINYDNIVPILSIESRDWKSTIDKNFGLLKVYFKVRRKNYTVVFIAARLELSRRLRNKFKIQKIFPKPIKIISDPPISISRSKYSDVS